MFNKEKETIEYLVKQIERLKKLNASLVKENKEKNKTNTDENKKPTVRDLIKNYYTGCSLRDPFGGKYIYANDYLFRLSYESVPLEKHANKLGWKLVEPNKNILTPSEAFKYISEGETVESCKGFLYSKDLKGNILRRLKPSHPDYDPEKDVFVFASISKDELSNDWEIYTDFI